MSELELYKGMVKKMKDEIKEKMTIGKAKKILRGFLAKDCYYDTPLYYAIPYLLDYITNLQQKNERLKDKSINEVLKIDFDMCVKDLKKANKKIEKATKDLFELKDMIYKPETRDENIPIQQKISSIIKQLNGRSDE